MSAALAELWRTCSQALGRLIRYSRRLAECGSHIVRSELASTRQLASQTTLYDNIRTQDSANIGLHHRLTILDNEDVQLGIFKGEETASYVNTVINIYDCFKNICP